MNRAWKITVILAWVFLVVGLHGCRKEAPIYPNWISYSAEQVGLESFREFTICADVSGNVYAVQATDETNTYKLFYLQKGSDGWQVSEFAFVPQDPYYLSDGNHMKSTTDGSVWLLGMEAMVRFKDGQVAQTYPMDQFIAEGVQIGISHFATFGSEVWLVHYSSGLFQLNVETGETFHYTYPGYVGTSVLLSVDNVGNKWITMHDYWNNIVGLMADGSWQRVIDPDSLLGCPDCAAWGGPLYEDFRAMVADGTGNTYLFTDTQLFRLSNGVVQSLALSIDPYIDGFTVDREDHLWFYRKDWIAVTPPLSILYRYKGGAAEETADLTQVFEGNVWPYDLAFDHNNNAWVATNMGIAAYNENGVEF
ncbi:MAG: hypothetical protein GC178_17845 [Flavobacteriales bacterium]|nr:hypothetical protein [Flavobacteriales bacterium]